MKELIACKYAVLLPYATDTLSVIGSIFWRWAEPDRFGILNEESPYNFIQNPNKELPKRNTPKETIQDLCLIIAKEIIDKVDREIVVSWSGGVDSTCIICSLILAGIPKSQLIVVYTQESIDENPNFYNWLRNNGYKMIKYSWTLSKKLYPMFPDATFITGWCADQLFGSNVNQRYPELYDKDYKDGLRYIILNRRIYDNTDIVDKAINKFGEYANRIELPIKYTCDALWLFNFAVKWSHVCMDINLTLPLEKQRENSINFFEDIRFQEWSIANYQNFYKHNQSTDIESYKKPLKEVIYSLNKDEDYLKNKGKVNSWTSSGQFRLAYTDMCIYDKDGYHILDLQADTPNSVKYKHPYHRQEANRRWYLKDYLKDWVDIEEYLRVDTIRR